MEFLYRLKLIDRLIPKENWTKEDEEIVSKHFQNLMLLKESNQLLLAGKTAGQDEFTIGLVIFRAESFAEAQKIMDNDPAIKGGIMTGFLQEYNTAILNKAYKND